MPNPQVLILGTGIAGLSAAIKFVEDDTQGVEVTLVSKMDAAEGATRYAQGGIASVWSKEDSFEEHKEDTLTAGAGLCQADIVDICVREGPERVHELIQNGVEFTRTGMNPTEEYDLHREGGHGQRRILHADDLTGWAIEKALLERAKENPRIKILECHVAIDLITENRACLGAHVLNHQTGEIKTLEAKVTILATGGAGKVYLYTSNPDVATGDGIAMAYRAGAQVANMEFMQFHPTCLYHSKARTFLISEALRGEGAVLRNLQGHEFLNRHHPMGSLAPRDIVARAIDLEIKRSGERHVLLDATHLDSDLLKEKFPNIYEVCMSCGIDLSSEPIPVVPAIHYTCGGVLVDENAQTQVDRLYAIGEVACTGLHGANRLASNSLLEAVVFAHRAVEHAKKSLHHFTQSKEVPPPLPEWDSGHAVEIESQIDIAATWLEVRTLMWNYVGIVRNNERLEKAKRRIDLLKLEVNNYYWGFLLTKDLVELRNLLTVAELIIQCAMLRKESRGLHYNLDYPHRNDRIYGRDTIV